MCVGVESPADLSSGIHGSGLRVLRRAEHFTFSEPNNGIVEIRDFGTTGVVAFARGCPFSTMQTGKLQISGHRVQVKPEYRDQALEAIDHVVAKLH